jgi:hypothetical protein
MTATQINVSKFNGEVFRTFEDVKYHIDVINDKINIYLEEGTLHYDGIMFMWDVII